MNSPGDVIRLVESANEVKVTLDEVKVVNSSCVELSWQWEMTAGDWSAVEWLRVRYWSSSVDPSSSALLPLSPSHYLLCGLHSNTPYELCLLPVYQTGEEGECWSSRQAFIGAADGKQLRVPEGQLCIL